MVLHPFSPEPYFYKLSTANVYHKQPIQHINWESYCLSSLNRSFLWCDQTYSLPIKQ